MNFYDKVHELVRELKSTEEYVEYMQMKEMVKQNNELYSKIKEFKDKQKEQQVRYVSGKEISEEEKQQMQNLYSIIIHSTEGAKYFESEIKFNVLLADIQKILGEGIQDVWNF